LVADPTERARDQVIWEGKSWDTSDYPIPATGADYTVIKAGAYMADIIFRQQPWACGLDEAKPRGKWRVIDSFDSRGSWASAGNYLCMSCP
jgi:hypothetical protein